MTNNVIKTIIIFFAAFALLISGSKLEKTEASAELSTANFSEIKEIDVVLDNNYPPYSFINNDGDLQGILIDQWALWEKKTGIKVHLNGMEWDSALSRMKKGEFDVIDTIFFNEERAGYFDFTKPYVKIEAAIYFQNNISGIDGPHSLKGFTVGVKAGDNAINVLEENGVENLTEYPNYEDIMKAVKNQEIVTFVMDEPAASYFLNKNNLQDKFNKTSALYFGEFHRAVKKDNKVLMDAIVKGFSMISSAEYNDIDKKWHGITQANIIPMLQIMVIFIIVGVIILLLFLWNMTLKKAVTTKTRVLAETLEKYKESQKYIYEMSIMDSLTGLFNRNYFDGMLNKSNEAGNADTGIVVCDIDGLKFINDTLGHSTGDDYLKEAAEILKEVFGDRNVVARLGGDEFAVLAENTTYEELSFKKQRIQELMKERNTGERFVPISISVGFAVTGGKQMDLKELFKAADNLMYREKLDHMQSGKSNNIKILMKMLEKKDYISEGHGERMQEWSVMLARPAGLAEIDTSDIRLLAEFHDIGKIGIADDILFKPDRLTAEEMVEMKRHSEIGFRVAEASADLKHISSFILKHHEWWNGQGYPFGLKAEEIPVQCRIIALADAFDAMTSDRPYRKALSRKAAIDEIIRLKGIQFDPSLVDIFVDLVLCQP